MTTMRRVTGTALAAALFALPVAGAAQAAAVARAAPAHSLKTLHYIPASDVEPDRILPAPPLPGSADEAAELAEVRRIVAAASPGRMAQARVDDEHEDPSIFDAAVGPDFTVKTLPATWALLKAVQNESEVVTGISKKYFHRIRPWGVDATLPNCDAGMGKSAVGSYPSGHSALGYSVGLMLAALIPGRAAAIQARAKDYAISRVICGVHYPSDTEASHVVGVIVTTRILTDARAAPMIAAARAELVHAGVTTR
jgi:acid phosphatase (class A)